MSTEPAVVAASIVGRRLADLIILGGHPLLTGPDAAELLGSLRILLLQGQDDRAEAVRAVSVNMVAFAAMQALSARIKADTEAARRMPGGGLQ